MTRAARTLHAIANTITIGLLAILYGAAYGCIGFYIGLAIYADGRGLVWLVAWLMAWVAVGSVILTVWTIRVTGIGAT